MPRQVRIQLPGAYYHVMCRGDRREPIFEDDDDRLTFLRTLGEAAGRTGWKIHAYALMDNHYHLLVETPEPNLVKGMTWFQTTYTVRYNATHKKSGHLFGGRYKAVLIDEDGRGGLYYMTLLDYIHLNPFRAGLVKADPKTGRAPDLTSYPWSSLTAYATRPSLRPEWLTCTGAFSAFRLKDGPRGRRDFVSRLEERTLNEKRKECGLAEIDGQGLQSTLRRGWCYGTSDFKEHLLEVADTALKKLRDSPFGQQNYRGADTADHDEKEAKTLLDSGLAALGIKQKDLEKMPKGAPEKALVAREIRKRTSVPLAWITNELRMGTTANVRQACTALDARLKKSPPLRKSEKRLLSKIPK